MTADLHVVGVRHHSPACARLVRHVIAAVRPRFVLIEGPAEMNGRLHELHLAHQPPIAVFTATGGAGSCWTPFCAWSPEWVALTDGSAIGAEVRFVDLPAWHPAFADRRNRYADGPDRHGTRIEALCRRTGAAGLDDLWDHLFEQPGPPEALQERLRLYFDEVRGEVPGDERDGPREAFMAEWVGWALAQGGPVVVVCGGWHAPVLRRAVPRPGPPPELPLAPAGAQAWLVPWSFERLDRFHGYDAGMPSPEWHRVSWEEGPDAAADALLGAVATRLRQRHQPVSPADLVTARTLTEGLARLRGHAVPNRVDVLDGIAGALVKDALDAPLPWTTGRAPSPRTSPLLVEVLAAFRGDARGRLHDDTPRPPLVADVLAALEAHDLAIPRTGRRVDLDPTAPNDLLRSRVLHRLRVLGVRGIVRASGPAWGTERVLTEAWRLAWTHETEASVIEAAGWGPTLREAAGHRVQAGLLAAEGRLQPLTAVLGDAAFAGLDDLVADVVPEVAGAIGRETELRALGAALERLLGLWRHGDVLGVLGSPTLARVIAAAWTRGLPLVEGVRGAAPLGDPEVRAVVALRDGVRHADALGIDVDRGLAVFDRIAADRTAPPALRGASLGLLWSVGDGRDGLEQATDRAVRQAARPEAFGDFLLGLFALAREPLLEGVALLDAVEEVLAAMPAHDFAIALPSLRLAFAWFPPAEKERLASAIARRHGVVADLTRPLPDDAARGLVLDAEVEALVSAWHLA